MLQNAGRIGSEYADDCNIYVKSRKAGARVMAGITRYIEDVLKLKVNRKKSAVDKPGVRKFLGFSFYVKEGKARNFVHAKSIQRFKDKVREITSRSNGRGMEWRRDRLARLITGWVNYFRIADMRSSARELDGWIRRRIRMCYWKQWKKNRTKRDNLVRLGLEASQAWEYANSRKGSWSISGSAVLNRTLSNECLGKLGFPSISRQLSSAY